MTDLDRRMALQRVALWPLAVGGSATLAQTRAWSGSATATDYLNGGLKGFVIGRVGGPLDDAFFDALTATGANVARVFWVFRRCESCTRFDRTGANVIEMRRLLGRARARNLRLIVVGAFEGADQPTFWASSSLRDSFVETWAWFASTFGNDSGLCGLDLMNEPVPPMPAGDVAQAQAAWHPLAEATINAIRAQGVTLPVVFEPAPGGNVVGLRGMTPFSDPQVVYSIHFYTPHDITHQLVAPTWARRIPYPAGPEWRLGGWDAELGVTAIGGQRLIGELRVGAAFQQRHGVPIYVGEFSCVRWAPSRSAYRWIRDCLQIFTLYGWSWTYHEFRGWPGWDAEIDSEDPATRTRTADASVMTLLRRSISDR